MSQDGITTRNNEALFLLRFIKDMEVMEIGTFKGVTTELLAQNNKEVITVDPYTTGYDDRDPASSVNLINVKREAEKRLQKYDNISMLLYDSAELVQTWKTPLDAVFIDGDHSEDGFKQDLKWIDKVSDNGIVAFHDYGNSTYPHLKPMIDEAMKGYKKLGQEGMMIIFKKIKDE